MSIGKCIVTCAFHNFRTNKQLFTLKILQTISCERTIFFLGIKETLIMLIMWNILLNILWQIKIKVLGSMGFVVCNAMYTTEHSAAQFLLYFNTDIKSEEYVLYLFMHPWCLYDVLQILNEKKKWLLLLLWKQCYTNWQVNNNFK